MGNSSAKTDAEKAELDILQHGISWWQTIRQQRNFHSLPSLGSYGRLKIVLESNDTPCETPCESDSDSDSEDVATMHSIKYTNPNTEHHATPLVVFGGYGSGTGIYYASLPGLCEMWKGPVYVVDFLGTGLSTRRPWTLGFGADADVTKVEDYFCDALEEWRKNMGIKQMVLTGHSMGGYISTTYCERYPKAIERLVLVSPVGVPNRDPAQTERVANAPWYFRLGFSMWESGYSPMALPGTWHLLGLHGNARYNDASWTNKELLRLYFHYNWSNGLPSAGARTHATLLHPGAFARLPLNTRIPKLVGTIPRISCIYGEKDWMGHYHFEAVKHQIIEDQKNNGEMKTTKNMPIDITRIADAGHNMMVDNPEGFLDAFWEIQKEAEKDLHNNSEGMKDGQIFGQIPWMRENKTFEKCFENRTVEGRSKNPKGTRKNPYMWTKCIVVEDHGNGTFKVQWKEGESKGTVSRNFGGHRLRLIEEEEVGACL